MDGDLLPNPHAGEILKYEFLEEIGITENELADAIDIFPEEIKRITRGIVPIDAHIDLRLCRYFGLSDGYFLRLQNAYELREAKRTIGPSLDRIIPLNNDRSIKSSDRVV